VRNRTLISGILVLAALGPAPVATAATNGRIAFQALDGRFPQVLTADPDGTSLRRITDLPRRFPMHPDWGPTVVRDSPRPDSVGPWVSG
jgi:hypothetical protein